MEWYASHSNRVKFDKGFKGIVMRCTVTLDDYTDGEITKQKNM